MALGGTKALLNSPSYFIILIANMMAFDDNQEMKKCNHE